MTGSFVIKKNRILEILFFIIIFLVNLKMTLNISDFATANLSILIIGISFISLLFTNNILDASTRNNESIKNRTIQ